ncbi:MAG: hemerythrin domain-containing protein [Ilumatobacteraceae bacterium]
MTTLMAPLHREHRKLLPFIEALRTTADYVGDAPLETVVDAVDASYRFLTNTLLPHASAEDEVLYPLVARAMGAPMATATMRRDHVEVQHLTEELGELRWRLHRTDLLATDLAQALRRVLYGLYALVSLHFAKEEEIYTPILERSLSIDEVDSMFASLTAAELAHR